MPNNTYNLLKPSAVIAACLVTALIFAGVALGSEVCQPPTLVWRATLPSPITAPVVAPNGEILVGCMNSKLYAFSPSGATDWSYTASGGIVGPPATDFLSNNYFGTIDGYVYGLRGDGSPKWSKPFSTGIPPYVPASPVYASPNTLGIWNLYFAAQSGHVYSIDASTKAVSWVFKMGGAGYASPAVTAGGTVYVGDANGMLYAINPDGSQAWSYNAGSRILGRPAVGASGEIYVPTYGSGLFALNPNGTVRWRYSADSLMTTSPAIGLDGTIYVCAYSGNVHAFNPDGSRKWTLATRDRLTGSPVLDLLGRVYVAGTDGYLRCIEPDGTQAWQYALGVPMSGSVGLGLGKLYTSGTNNTLYAFDVPDLVPEPISFASLFALTSGLLFGARGRKRRNR